MQNRKKKIIGGVVAAFVVLGIGSAVAGGSDSPSARHSAVAKQPVKQAKGNDSASHPAKTQPTYSVAQQNAIRSAKDYLSFEPFSKKGLIEQLHNKNGDGYALPLAVFAVNHVNADWNKEAVKAAKSYLDMSGFSRSGLIEQLSSQYGDQFTHQQAVYAANHVGL